MPRGGEPVHISETKWFARDADLGNDDLRGQVTDAGNGPQQADRPAGSAQADTPLRQGEIAVHLRVELAQVQAQQEAVPLGDACSQHGPQLLGRRFDAMLRQGKLKLPLIGRDVGGRRYGPPPAFNGEDRSDRLPSL